MNTHPHPMIDSFRSLSPIRVVIADDHPMVRLGIVQYLSQQPDIEVIGDVADGDAALSCVQALHPDVLLLDIRMPGMPVVTLLDHLHRLAMSPYTLIMTGFAEPELVMTMLQCHAQGYIVKDEDPATLVGAVRAVARGETWLSPKVAVSTMKYAAQHEYHRADSTLSDREEAVIELLGEGKTNLEIGVLLHISERTVRYHLRNIYDKLGLQRRSEAVAWAARRQV